MRLRWSRGSGDATLVIIYDSAGVEGVVLRLSLYHATPLESSERCYGFRNTIRLRWSRGSGDAAFVITYDSAGPKGVVVQLSL